MSEELSKKVGVCLLKHGEKLVTAESCTAGLISSMVAETPGSSSWLVGGFVVYTPQMKHDVLGVSFDTIEKYDITSEDVAREMAIGALNRSVETTISISVTGVSGPSGGTDEIPVGTVCIGWGRLAESGVQVITEKCFFDGTRNEIREKVAKYALSKLCTIVEMSVS